MKLPFPTIIRPQSDRAAAWTPQQPQTSLPPSPLQQVLPPQHANLSDGQGMKKGSLAIVDYMQDETTMSPEAEEKINRFLAYKRAGKSFNAEVRNRKDYRNPDFLLHAVRYQDIDQIGSCFSKDVFDPHGYDKSDYYDEIEADMKCGMERKEQERKKSQKVEFVAGGTQPGTVAAAPKVNMIPGVSTIASSGLHSLPPASDAMTKDSRPNKKSKWDKVDGDRRPDPVSTAGTHAALLSAANVGAGYTAFAQQKRREAEEKRSSERKLEKRS
ncbi:PREDICTED: SAP30-binding protein isoform X2 [Nelumbo nucifera]|uniref:SAP30-binding protein isoform X2 n=1 Tax=Nelumbo nucifera TaxID=4432 RepID=A0A1U8QC88_NELNU|nr:PREDICTED: SAP30-binding protein isoform X2 [Nelumbo nucifera]